MQITVHAVEEDEEEEDGASSRVVGKSNTDVAGSGFMADDTFLDDEDYRGSSEAIRVSFQCEYVTSGQSSKVRSSKTMSLKQSEQS